MESKTLLNKRVLKDEVKNYLSERIIQGDYSSGERLIETQIAKNLGISQAPVREALRDLEQIGLIRIEPYKGAYVHQFSIQDLKNAYTVRSKLEVLAIEYAIQNIRDDELQKLNDIYEQMLIIDTSGDIQKQIMLDIEFHEIIVKASRNNVLTKVWESVSIAQWTYFGTLYHKKYNAIKLVERHLPIIESLYKKDAEMAKQTIHTHFGELQELLEKS